MLISTQNGLNMKIHMPRTIIHLDMNAFFASVEQQCNPALRGKPIAVVGRGSRTVVTTASYEARAFGVKTGMNTFEAKRQCPHIIFVEGNNRRYTDTCAGFTAICREFTPLVEVFSIDEVFMDVTGSLNLFGPARDIVREIKQQIKNRYGLTCSAGIAPNKLLAKLASDREKPDGLVEIAPDTVAPFLEDLPAGELCGIGAKTQWKLGTAWHHHLRPAGPGGQEPAAPPLRRGGRPAAADGPGAGRQPRGAS